ncbi:MAG: hypothetical protein A3J27_09455 [Candidatus Tectomicrobia bacterium RIFCSPLOWO2_12_FULL_69_37]|nr:MAG: hypothetical protein A3J27_09455 [Candidatus Tectomicrobia bacterium RIFCSPLOWO2_12_FULL_69_37]
MSPKPRVAMVSSEMYPFAKSGGLGDVLGALPPALARQGVEVSVFLPAYKSLLQKGGFAPLNGDLPDAFGAPEVRYTVFKGRFDGAQVYAVRSGDLFDREGFYGDDGGEYPDNALRFSRFCRGVLSALGQMGSPPEILHCHDWQSALVPALLKTRLGGSPAWARTASVMTIHNLGYQGRYASDDFQHTGLPPEAFGIDGVEYYGDLNLLKGGIVCAEVVSTVSESYAQEIQTAEQGNGLEGVIASRAGDLLGIMNGVDYAVWDPAKDPCLAASYSREDMEGKAACRRALRTEMGLKGGGRGGPLCVMVSRLASQKGVELLMATLEDLLWMGLEVAVLGTGEVAYETSLRRAAERHHKQMAFRGLFNERLAHLFFAGGDLLLMPSRYEPAGLNQLYAMRYGTLPLVRTVGGLASSVIAHKEIDLERDTGFQFQGFNPAELLWGVVRACRAFEDKEAWRRLVWNAMSQDFSWDRIVPRYLELYEGALARRAARG